MKILSIYIFNKPVFVWFGILTFIMLVITLIIGFNIKKFGFKAHKTSAIITVLLAIIHLIGALLSY